MMVLGIFLSEGPLGSGHQECFDALRSQSEQSTLNSKLGSKHLEIPAWPSFPDFAKRRRPSQDLPAEAEEPIRGEFMSVGLNSRVEGFCRIG